MSALALAGMAYHAGAQNLPPPVSGLEILNLAGQTIQNGEAAYSADFVASSTESTVTFTFRQDPSFMTLYDVNVSTGGGPNLLQNGDFSVPSPEPGVAGGGVPDWTYFIQTGNLYPEYLGFEANGGFYDGSTQAYDGIDQSFPTVIGDTYDVTFGLNGGGYNDGALYRATSDNGDTTDTGGDGIDLVVYAGNGLPPATTPDAASTLGLLGAAMAGLTGLRRKLA